jgi:hypothetical protein
MLKHPSGVFTNVELLLQKLKCNFLYRSDFQNVCLNFGNTCYFTHLTYNECT